MKQSITQNTWPQAWLIKDSASLLCDLLLLITSMFGLCNADTICKQCNGIIKRATHKTELITASFWPQHSAPLPPYQGCLHHNYQQETKQVNKLINWNEESCQICWSVTQDEKRKTTHIPEGKDNDPCAETKYSYWGKHVHVQKGNAKFGNLTRHLLQRHHSLPSSFCMGVWKCDLIPFTVSQWPTRKNPLQRANRCVSMCVCVCVCVCLTYGVTTLTAVCAIAVSGW